MNPSNLLDFLTQNKQPHFQIRQYEFHRRKIETIMTKSSNSLSFRRDKSFSNFHSSKDKAKRFAQKMKQQQVDKQNDLMLKKIINVNKRSQSHHNGSIVRDLSHNNLSNLKKKLEQTNQENQKLANKLVLATSKLSQQFLGQDYRRHIEIKQRLKKYTFDSQTGMVIPKNIKSLVRMNQLEPLRQNISRES